jgi:hypothetical protein
MPFFSAITQPIASILGAGIGGAASLIGGNQANAANAQMAARQMDFQENMRATQYQTAVADLKAAGLNPMLAYTQGGAGTPSGASATMQNVLGQAGNSAKEGAIAVAQYANMRNQNVLIEEQAEKTNADRYLSLDQAANVRANTMATLAQMPGFGKFGELRDATIDQLRSSSALQAAQLLQAESQTGYNRQLIRLAGEGSAPSSQKPIYQDVKNMLHNAWNQYKSKIGK